ncbi:hypothetical protein VXS06_14745 [Photobacterium toruni]|uniref:Uncharacterized protein n=1 Tax=Photobacterium toruni TaxID=1935446 RepID=A0ABU6LCJ5_9GAMM|nr:hypothetical protein [Photobacterium toruni]
MTTSTVATKLNISGAGGDALERFCTLYNSRSGGKSALLNDLLAGGLMLKETGLLDLVINLDESNDYRKLSNKDKTRVLICELAELFGNVETSKPAIPNEPRTVSADTHQQPEPEPVKPVVKAKLPDLGL